MQLAYIYGRTPRLAHKELEATATILPFRWSLISVQTNIDLLKSEDGEIGSDFFKNGSHSEENQKLSQELQALHNRLGGVLRTVYIYKQVPKANVQSAIQELLTQVCGEQTGKVSLGVSIWGRGLQPLALAKSAKAMLRELGLNARFVTNPDGQLTTAQVMHNHLDYVGSGGKGAELVLIEEQGSWHVGATLSVQDITQYSKRDFAIPAPDPVSGMLSPKLAQSMINIAVGGQKDAVVYDPFCGNGRVLLEAWNMGIRALGSDVVEKKVRSAERNLDWLRDSCGVSLTPEVWVADATTVAAREQALEHLPAGTDWYIVCEPYLGKPLRAPLPSAARQEWLNDLIPLYQAFFERWSASEVPANRRPKGMLVVIPRAKVQGGGEAALYDLIVDRLGAMGYSSNILFCYDRPDSQVRRDLVQIAYDS